LVVTAGECTNLHWKVDNVISVLFNDQPATGNESREVCPKETTTYSLRVTGSAGAQEYTLTIQVAAAGETTLAFEADKTLLAPGECATLSWNVTDVKEVRLNGQGVAGVATQQVCPTQPANYDLVAVTNTGQTLSERITITVQSSEPAFWADQYALESNACTTLRWSVQNVQSVYLNGEGVSGVGQKDQVCPTEEMEDWTLEINGSDGSYTVLQAVLTTNGGPALAANEIIAQGSVTQLVGGQGDVDPIEPGEQPGYKVTVDGVRVLFAGTPGYDQPTVTLGVPQAFIDQADEVTGLHWPVRTTQPVEFRATCDGATCWLDFATEAYLYWRAP
jgi:hypothetical protein